MYACAVKSKRIWFRLARLSIYYNKSNRKTLLNRYHNTIFAMLITHNFVCSPCKLYTTTYYYYNVVQEPFVDRLENNIKRSEIFFFLNKRFCHARPSPIRKLILTYMCDEHLDYNIEKNKHNIVLRYFKIIVFRTYLRIDKVQYIRIYKICT